MKKIAMVTGATSGIGEAAARRFASEGYDLIITGRRNDRLQALKASLEAADGDTKVLALNFDVRERLECNAAVASIPAEFRSIDVLLNNAGLAAGLEHIEEGDPDDWDAMIDTNVKGLLYITRAVVNVMIENQKGHIVNLGSIAGTQPYENGSAYCASKHAVHALSQSMRIDLLTKGIKVTEIRPGMVKTEFSLVRFHGDESRADAVYNGITPLLPEDIAEAIYWAVSLPKHVNIDDILLTPTAQANAYYTHRSAK